MTRLVVVAECGVNHQGDMDTAKKMIEKAKECQADYAKFQYFNTDDHFFPEDDPRFGQVKNAQLSLDQLRELKIHCERVGIEFLCTPFFSTRRVEELATIGVIKCKIREADSQKEDMINKSLELFDEVLISTTKVPLNPFYRYNPHLKFLMATSKYPYPIEELDLGDVGRFDGFSCHIPSIVAPLAVASVAKALRKEEFIIECHVTLSHDENNLDKEVSLDFSELAQLVGYLGTVERIK